MKNHQLYRFLLVGCLLLLLAGLGYSQGTDLGTIRGTVTDSQGAVVAGAKVTIIDTATSIAVERTTDGSGNYEVPNVKSGTYRATVELEGFNTAQIVDVIVRVGATARVDAKLSPKTLAESVTVTSEAPLIQTEAPVVSGALTTQQILDLPRDSRDIYSFLYLNPNITYNPDDGFKFIGGTSYGANFSMDGQRATGAGFGVQIGGQPSMETVGEINVLSNSFSAEYAGIANIRVTTKRGTQDYHGSLFYDNKNAALAAWRATDKIDKADFTPSFFQPEYPNPHFNWTETGGSIGGPVPGMKKRTFFMFAFEHRWDAHPVRWSSSNKVPHESMLEGDFSKLSNSAKPAVPASITLTPDEIANYTLNGEGKQFVRIPSRLLNPYTKSLVDQYFPHTSMDAPINSSRGYVPSYTNLTKGLQTRPLYTGRVDHDFSDRDRIYGVINASTLNDGFSQLNNPFDSLGLAQFHRQNETLSLSWIHTFAPTLINEARGGLNYQTQYQHANQTVTDFLSSIGFSQGDISAYADAVSPLAPDFWGTFPIYFGSSSWYGPFGNMGRNADRSREDKMWSVGDTVSWVKGKHSIRTGFDMVHNYVVDGFTIGRGNPRGRINYPASTSGWAQFLLGLPPTSIQRNIAPRGPMHVHNWEHGYFIQDDFKVTPRLTLNLGLRYELVTPFIEEDDLLVNFDFNYTNPDNGNKGRFVIPSEKIAWAAPGVAGPLDRRMVAYGYTTADKLGLGRALVNLDKNNLAPRLGAAFRLTDKMVLRGGYGIMYPTSAAQGMRDSMATNSFNQSITFTSRADLGMSLGSWPTPFTGGRQNYVSSVPSVNAIPFGLQQPRIQQFNFTFERELGWKSALRVSYLGTRVWGLGAGIDQNAIAPSDVGLGTTIGDGVTPCDPINEGNCDLSDADRARIPYPGLGDWLMINGGNFGIMRSNAFQMEFNRRYATGLMFNASYTLLQQENSVTDADSSLGDPVYNAFQPTADMGADSYVSRHRFIAYGSYELPVGIGRRFGSGMNKVADALVGGWKLSTNMFIKSGTRFTPFWECNNCGPIMPGNIFSTAITAANWNGMARPTVTGDPNISGGGYIWDINAMGPPSTGADFYTNPAAAKRNSLMGPGVWNANLAIDKTFKLSERIKLSFRGTFDNVFNHPTFAPIGWGGEYDIARVGDFSLNVDPNTLKLMPIAEADMNKNPDFGRLYSTFSHENISDRREVRLSLRLTF